MNIKATPHPSPFLPRTSQHLNHSTTTTSTLTMDFIDIPDAMWRPARTKKLSTPFKSVESGTVIVWFFDDQSQTVISIRNGCERAGVPYAASIDVYQTYIERTSNVQSVESMSDQPCLHVSTTVRTTKNNRIWNIITLQNCVIETAEFSIFG